MRMPVTAEDILVGIFYHLKLDKHDKVTADRETLHRVFYGVRERHPGVMALFSFRERELFPESSQLDQALSNLDAAGLISRRSPAPRFYRFEDPLVSCYKKFSKDLLRDAGIDEDEMNAVAQEIDCLTTGN
jgi:hypothetical protein